MNSGDIVRVKAPFNETYHDTYTVIEEAAAEDGQPIVILDGVEPAFAPGHLEIVE